MVEIDEKGYTDRNRNKENERQIKIEKRLNCKFYRNNSDVLFDIFVGTNKTQICNTKSSKNHWLMNNQKDC